MTTPQDNEDQSSRLSGAEQKLALLDYRLSSTEAILTELKDAVVKLVLLNHEQKELRADLEQLRKDFEERKKETTPVIDNAKSVIARFYGGLSVVILLIALLSYVGSGSLAKLDDNIEKTAVQETRIMLLERDVEYNRNK